MIEEKLLKFQAESREFAKFLKSPEQYIQTVKGQNNFWEQSGVFLTSSWRFLRSNKLEQLDSNCKKLLGFRNMQEKFKHGHFCESGEA